VKSKIGEVFFLSACYDKAAGEGVTLSCRLLAQREEGNHTFAVARAHVFLSKNDGFAITFQYKVKSAPACLHW
jgi:hypothetical protein